MTLHGHQHQHDSEVHSDDGFEEESLKVDRGMAHYIEKNCRQEDGQQDIHESASEEHVNSDTQLTTD